MKKISFKIREHTLQKVPYLLVIGDKEVATNSVSVRSRDGQDLGVMTIETLCSFLKQEVDNKGLSNNQLED